MVMTAAKTPKVAALRLRLVPDTSAGERVKGYDPRTGAKTLINPATNQSEPWPLLGVEFVDGAPKTARVPTKVVARGVAEGWAEFDNPRPVYRPGGPPEDPQRVTHAFTHADAVIFKTPDGDIRYTVTRQPDKYAVASVKTINADKGLVRVTIAPDKEVTPEVYASGETHVEWTYDLRKEG